MDAKGAYSCFPHLGYVYVFYFKQPEHRLERVCTVVRCSWEPQGETDTLGQGAGLAGSGGLMGL